MNGNVAKIFEASVNLSFALSTLDLFKAPLSDLETRETLELLSPHWESLFEHVRFDETTYCRNRLYRSEFVDLLLLCWRPGQRTPLHDHAGSRCGVKLLQGEATEIFFSKAGNGTLIPAGSKTLSAGSITVSRDSDIHMLANLSASKDDLVTLHCYSPPLEQMQVYSQAETFLSDYDTILDSAATSGCYNLPL